MRAWVPGSPIFFVAWFAWVDEDLYSPLREFDDPLGDTDRSMLPPPNATVDDPESDLDPDLELEP